MKHLILSFLVVTLLIESKAQVTDSTYTEVGLNATAFINQYLDFGSGNGEFSSPYMITYEHRFGKFGIRGGLGVNGSNSNDKPENGEPSAPEFHSNEIGLNTRVGFLKYYDISSRWTLKLGLDGLYSQNTTSNCTTITNLFGEKVTNTNEVFTWNSGVSPFVFAQFSIGKHFSIATELLGSITYGKTITKVQSSEFPEFDSRQESVITKYGIAPPTSLFFIFRF